MAKYDFDADIPENERTLAAIWSRRVAIDGDAPLLWQAGRMAGTTAQLEAERRAAAQIFLHAGVRKGDRVCVLMQNSPKMLATMLALWSIGAVVVPLSAQLVGAILQDQVERARAALIVCDDELRPRLASSARSITRSALFSTTGERGDVMAEAPMFHEPALILYTSGSTGPSKGCMLSHHFCIYYAWTFWRYMGYRRDDTIYSCLPLNHVHALFASFLPAVLAGARFSFSERFSASRYWQEIVDSGATTCSAIGPIATILLGQPVSEIESRLRVRLAHIAPAPARAEEFERRFGLQIVSALYGMSEAMIFPPNPDLRPIMGTIGVAPPDWEVQIVDELDRKVPIGQAGELVARPRRPHILFDGYMDMPEQTARAWRGLWYRTGDICRCDEDGMFWFMGRARDLIRRGGENISAWELESILSGHPQVAEAAALPLRIDAGEDHVAVVVRCVDGATITPRDLHFFARAVLPRFMWPDWILVRDDELPKNQAGKIDKLRLAALCREHPGTTPPGDVGPQ